jgi:hypothetical protein
MGAIKLCVILGPKSATADFGQRKAHITDKESSLSFRFVALRVLGLLERRPQNDLDNESNIIFASSFVWSNTKTRFALCESFRPPFSKGGPAGARSPANEQFDKSKFEVRS